MSYEKCLQSAYNDARPRPWPPDGGLFWELQALLRKTRPKSIYSEPAFELRDWLDDHY